MSASLNIKDPEAHRLAQAIAQETGEPMTRVVIEALRASLAKLHRHSGKASIDELRAIAKRSGALVRSPYAPHGDELYDAGGLPK